MSENSKKAKRKHKEADRGIVDFMRIEYHFFSAFNDWIGEIEDPRNSSYIKYSQQDYIWLGIIKNVCGQKTIRCMDENFNEETCITTLRLLSGNMELDEMPHYDSLNWYPEKLSPPCLSEIRKRMVTSLIRTNNFQKNRALGKYWRVILDGTGLFYFKERHCDNCLAEKHKDDSGNIHYRYYHKVLEAKLVLSDKLVISLKKEYPRLPILIQADGLYASEPLMAECRKNNWHYLFTFKEGCMKTVWDEYAVNCADDECCHKKTITYSSTEEGTGRYVNGLEAYTGKSERMNVFSYESESKKKLNISWITDLEITGKKLGELIRIGRGRWKIENEGFNNQKNGIYDICHLNSRDTTAMKMYNTSRHTHQCTWNDYTSDFP